MKGSINQEDIMLIVDTYVLCKYLLGGPEITANLYCICLSEHETCAYADAVPICSNI